MFLFDEPFIDGWIGARAAGVPAAPNAGVGTDAPIMLVGNSLPIGLSTMWWGGATGTTDGNTQHTVAGQFRADYAGPISRGIGDGTQIGPAVTTKMLWDRPEGDWGANNDPRRDLAGYAGGAMLYFEGFTHGAISVSRPYFDWLGNEHRVELLQDIDYAMRFARAAAQAGVAIYLGGTWPPLIENPPNDAAWRPLVDAFDVALRYRRDVLSARLRAEGLPAAVWIVPTHLMFGRFYDDDQAGLLPAGLTSHRDFHALDTVGHAGSVGAGNHPYMPNPLSAYCAWCMVREVVMGEDSSAMPPWPVDGVTTDLAAYLRGVAVDIARSYAPAGLGGSQHADPGYIEPIAAAPQAALGASFAASWIGGATATATPPGPLDYGGVIISATDLSALANTHVELGRITGADGRHVIVQAWDWGGGDQLEVSFHAADGNRLVGVQIQLPSAGNWLFEWRNLPSGLTMRRVNLDAPAEATDKVATSVAWPPEYATDLPAGASAVAATPPAWINLQAVWAGTQIPDAAQMVGLNAWIDDLTGLVAWDGTRAAYQRVVVIGASLEYSMYLNSLTAPFGPATDALGLGIPVYGCATSGARTRALIANVQQAVAAFPAVGETLFLVHPTGNDITSSLEYSQRSPAQLDALRLDLNDFLDAFGAHLPHVVPIPSSFRSYAGRGYGAREIYNAQEKGSKPFNDNVFGPIYQDRTRSRWRYADGGDMMCFYDMTRNDFETYLQADGIHFTWPGVTGIRAEQMRRLRLWLSGTPAAQIVPDPMDPPSPLIVTPASITPASGAVGTRFVLTPATFSGDPTPAVAGVLTLDGQDVTSQIDGDEYASDAEGQLVYTSTGTNSHGSTPSVAEALVQDPIADRAIYLNFVPVALALPGLNDIIVPSGTTQGLGPVALVDQDGAATGATYQLSKEGGGGLVSVGYNTGTWTTNTTPWDGSTLFATEILDDTWYVPYAPDPAPGQVPLHRFAGLVAGATYQIQMVASRQSATGRTCTFTHGGVSIALDPAANPAVMGAASFVADASGVITLRQTITGTFGYICGLTLVRVS